MTKIKPGYSVEFEDYFGEIIHSVKIKKATKHSDRYKQGINLLTPTDDEMDDAIETAYKDGFDIIWIHELFVDVA